MDNNYQLNPAYEKYRGLRAVILTRVSTPEQAKKYSHAAQERQVREKLIQPLGLRIVDPERHIIHDTYSGLEYRYRKVLADILEMAEREEFDLLCMDVLDRGLGRRALARELFRMQLRELGIRILTTQESDHADDDSLEGQVMRFFKGSKAEEEINDFVRRSKDGKREKVLGNPEQGIPGCIIGAGDRLYGYKFVVNEKGKHVGYELNGNIIFVEEDGTEWTEVKVVIFIFESIANGVSLRGICRILDAKGIPTPHVTKGKKRHKNMKEYVFWQHNTIKNIIRDTAYYGEYRQFKEVSTGRIPGQKAPSTRLTTEDEQVIIPIPPIITKELYEKANWRKAFNKQLSPRNNKTPNDYLLRGGFARCAYCEGALNAWTRPYTYPSGEQITYRYYNCSKATLENGKPCGGCCIPAYILENDVTDYIFELIRNPSELDKKIEAFKKDNSIKKQRERARESLNKIRQEQARLRTNLGELLKQEHVDKGTQDYLNGQLQLLAKQEEDALKEIADERRFQEQYKKLEERVAKFHRQCEEWRKQLDNPEFTPTFEFKREALIFLGITVVVWRSGTWPRCQMYSDPPEIMELLSMKDVLLQRRWLPARESRISPGAEPIMVCRPAR